MRWGLRIPISSSMSLAAMLLLLYVFASFGVAFVLGYSKITLPFRTLLGELAQPHDGALWESWLISSTSRWLLALLECPACVAFWLGMAATATPIADALPFTAPIYFIAPILGFANLGAVLSLGLLTKLIRTE